MGDSDGTDTGGGSDSDRAAARLAQGLPASVTDLTDEQRQRYLGAPTVAVTAVDSAQVQVVAMQDGGTNDDKEVA